MRGSATASLVERPTMFKPMKVMALSGLAWCALQVHAQGYPQKPIRVVLGYTVGGAADAAARPDRKSTRLNSSH